MPGFDFGPRLQEQATGAGATVEPAEVARIERRGEAWCVVTDSREVTAGAVIAATGSRPRKLGLAREDELEGKGLSHCASCDGPLFRGNSVAMVGGGDSALLETLELGGHDVQVVLVDYGEAFSGQETYARRVLESTYVEVRRRTVVEEFLGDGRVEGLRLRDLASDDRRRSRSPESSSTSGAFRTPRCSTGSLRSTSTAASRQTRGCGQSFPACSPRATSAWTRPARRSPPPATAQPRRSRPTAIWRNGEAAQRQASTETVAPGMLRNFARIGEPMKMLKWPFVSPPATRTLILFVSKIGISSSGGAFR